MCFSVLWISCQKLIGHGIIIWMVGHLSFIFNNFLTSLIGEKKELLDQSAFLTVYVAIFLFLPQYQPCFQYPFDWVQVYLRGGQVTSWKNDLGEELLFLSNKVAAALVLLDLSFA